MGEQKSWWSRKAETLPTALLAPKKLHRGCTNARTIVNRTQTRPRLPQTTLRTRPISAQLTQRNPCHRRHEGHRNCHRCKYLTPPFCMSDKYRASSRTPSEPWYQDGMRPNINLSARSILIRNRDDSFNSITGLNGSGKSNILDAICFVLGITNMNTVRAQNLQVYISSL